jgi:NAD+ diphosphatase
MFTLCFDPSAIPAPEDYCLIYNEKNDLLLGDGTRVPTIAETRASTFPVQLLISEQRRRGAADRALFLGNFGMGNAWLAGSGDLGGEQDFHGSAYAWVPLRSHLSEQTPDWKELAFRGLHLFHWLKRVAYCASCGGPLVMAEREMAQACPTCHGVWYPLISPAMIVAVTRNGGREILLAQGKNRSQDWYSLIAGFCEAGESVERTVVREVREEVGIAIKNLRYASSQGWPFSQSMMLGFTAEWDSGELRPDPNELDNAAWFSVDDLPFVPPPPSIANQLISLVVAQAKHG